MFMSFLLVSNVRYVCRPNNIKRFHLKRQYVVTSLKFNASFFSSLSEEGINGKIGGSTHPIQSNALESNFLYELKHIAVLLGKNDASLDMVTDKYFHLRRKILELNNDNTDVDDVSTIFDEDITLFLLKRSTYHLNSSINQFTKIQVPKQFSENPENFISDSEIEEHAVKLELFQSATGLVSLWRKLVEAEHSPCLVNFVSNLVLALAIKTLKFEEIQFLLNKDKNDGSFMLPTCYAFSENFLLFKQWLDEFSAKKTFDVCNFSFLIFDVLFLKLFSIGEKKAIVVFYVRGLRNFLSTYGSPKCEQSTRRVFRIVLSCLTSENFPPHNLTESSNTTYSSLSSILSPDNLTTSIQNRYLFIYQSLFESSCSYEKDLVDGRSIALFSKWIVEHFMNDPRALSSSLEQIYHIYRQLVTKFFANQPHLIDHAEISFLLSISKIFLDNKCFSEAYHVLSLSITKISFIFDKHLSKKKDSFFIQEYLDIMTRATLMLSAVFSNASREGLLKPSNITNNGIGQGSFSKNNATSPRLFSFERLDSNAPMRRPTFLSLLFSDMTNFSPMLFNLVDLHPTSYSFVSGIEGLLTAKIRLSIAIFPSLLNFSYNSAILFLTALKDEEHFLMKIQMSNFNISYHPTVHSLNFILGIAILPKSIGSTNMKDLVFSHIFKDTAFRATTTSANRPYVYRFLDAIDSLLPTTSSFSKKIISSILEYDIKPNFYTIYYFCRGSFASLINTWLFDKNLEQSTSYAVLFICRLLENPEMLGLDAPNYPMKNLTLPMEYDVIELPFMGIASQFLFLLRGHSFYPRAFGLYASILKRTAKCAIFFDDHYEFRYNFIFWYYSFLSRWEILPNNTPISILSHFIWSQITEFIGQSDNATSIFPLCPEVFSFKSGEYQQEYENRIVEDISKSVSEYVKRVSIVDVRSWISKLEADGITTVGAVRNIAKSTLSTTFSKLPPEACYLILNCCAKPSFVVEQIPFNATKQIYAHYCPVLNTKSGRLILTCQFVSR